METLEPGQVRVLRYQNPLPDYRGEFFAFVILLEPTSYFFSDGSAEWKVYGTYGHFKKPTAIATLSSNVLKQCERLICD